MSDIVKTLADYETSRNYRLLYDLASRASYVCVVDFIGYGQELQRDVAQTIHYKGFVTVCSRGVTFVAGYGGEADFIEQCEECNLEWIMP